MSNSDSDTEAERRSDPRIDNWPVERHDAYANVPVERATERGEGERIGEAPEGGGQGPSRDDIEWIGFVGRGGSVSGPFLYDSSRSAIFEGEHDEANERIVLDEESRRDVESERSLGEHLEELGDEHGWTWLSSFARRYLEDDAAETSGADGETTAADGETMNADGETTAAEETAGTDETAGAADATGTDAEELVLNESEFTQRNLADSTTVDLGFFGSHTLEDEAGRLYVVDRFFAVEAGAPVSDGDAEGDDAPDRVTVGVEEEFLLPEAPEADRREGDAELAEERQYSFELEVEDAVNWAASVESYLRKWHAAHVGWPSDARRS